MASCDQRESLPYQSPFIEMLMSLINHGIHHAGYIIHWGGGHICSYLSQPSPGCIGCACCLACSGDCRSGFASVLGRTTRGLCDSGDLSGHFRPTTQCVDDINHTGDPCWFVSVCVCACVCVCALCVRACVRACLCNTVLAKIRWSHQLNHLVRSDKGDGSNERNEHNTQ